MRRVFTAPSPVSLLDINIPVPNCLLPGAIPGGLEGSDSSDIPGIMSKT